jgi:hypothetical protein
MGVPGESVPDVVEQDVSTTEGTQEAQSQEKAQPVKANEVSALAGTCQGGPRAGQYCNSSSDCGKSCLSGVKAGQSCTFDSDCGKSCLGGIRAGQSCTFNSDCYGSQCLGTSCLGSPCW